MSAHSASRIELRWREPYADGIWLDSSEVQVVQLPDSYLLGGSAHGFLAPQPLYIHVPEGDEDTDPGFRTDAVRGPWVLQGGNFSGHNIVGLPPWTAYRVRSRVKTIVGWSRWSASAVVCTAGKRCACCAPICVGKGE